MSFASGRKESEMQVEQAAAGKVVGFTPGPWFAEQQVSTKDGHSLGWIINHANGRIGWSSYSTAVPNAGEPSPHPVGEANAYLIAGAPAMLSELREILSWATTEREPLGENELDSIRAVIAAATGAQP